MSDDEDNVFENLFNGIRNEDVNDIEGVDEIIEENDFFNDEQIIDI
jgi:hypothetical protein